VKKEDWYGVKTCNLGLHRQDFMDVNGFNEEFTGWGHEDADLAIRLIRNGIRRKEGNFATTVFHCYHKEVPRADEQRNRDMLEVSKTGAIKIKHGVLSTP
jgi:predicted glycosyltransferase involved in capsule biosynthesis